jgi:hypothetical protein
MSKKNTSIQDVSRAIEEHFGPGTFVAQPTNSPNSALFKKERPDETVTLSIVKIDNSEKPYSVQVECKGDKYLQCIGRTDRDILYWDIDIPIDREVDLKELIEIFGEFE